MSASTRSDGYQERLAALMPRSGRRRIEVDADTLDERLEEIATGVEGLEKTHERLTAALDDIAQKALHAQTHGSMGTTLTDIHNACQTALQRPLEGTRVRCLMPHRGEQGTIVGWDEDLGVALVTWDDLSGLPPEGVEPGEYEIIQ